MSGSGRCFSSVAVRKSASFRPRVANEDAANDANSWNRHNSGALELTFALGIRGGW